MIRSILEFSLVYYYGFRKYSDIVIMRRWSRSISNASERVLPGSSQELCTSGYFRND